MHASYISIANMCKDGLYIFVHLRERRWEVLVALPDTFTASRLVFFDWHLPKFDVNIDRVISCDFVPVLADCREAAAEAVGHLNLGILAALAEYWERGTLKENFKRMKIVKTSNSMKFRWILRSKSQLDKVHHFLTMFWLDFSGSRPVQALNALEAETFGLWRNRIWLTLSLTSPDGICKYWIIEYL